MKLYTTLVLLIFYNISFTQVKSNIQTPISINADGTLPSDNAILDINSNQKGILIPRLDFLQRMNITNPEEGLLIYQLDSMSGFYYFDGNIWNRIQDNLNLTESEECFNVSHPDGLSDNNESVHQVLNDGMVYVVPPFKNFHGYVEMANTSANYLLINGDSTRSYSWNKLILKSGDTLSYVSSTDSLFINGYLVESIVTPIHFNVADNPYVVPFGKKLYLKWVINSPFLGPNFASQLFVDGVPIKWTYLVFERSNACFLTIDAGSIITTDASNENKEMFINGFLK